MAGSGKFPTLILLCLAMAASPAWSKTQRLVEPKLFVQAAKSQAASAPNVALTFDACSGLVDHRILDYLVANRIPATLFITARWARHNPAAIQILLANRDLFEIENHGENHVPAVDVPMAVYGLKAAGSPAAVLTEVKGGEAAIEALGFARPTWFRGATARYTKSAIADIGAAGFKIGGYSLNGDSGATLSARPVARRFANARNGDVILAHINQPTHPSGQGVVMGITLLKARGTHFVRLNDVATSENPIGIDGHQGF